MNIRDPAEKLRASRKVILTKIRCTLVKNPYDVGGRKLAVAAKKLFIRKILKDNKWYHKISDAIEIPKSIKKCKYYRLFSKNWATIIASLVVLRGTSVYWYDIYSDYAVIRNIEKVHENFQYPMFSDLQNNSEFKNSSKLLLNLMENPNVDFIKNPCEVLKWVEDTIRAKTYVYEYIFHETCGIRIVPDEKNESAHKNTEHIYDISDSLELVENFLQFLNNTYFRFTDESLEGKGRSIHLIDIPKKLDGLITIIKEV